jgi:GTP-binding protein Era
MPKVGFVAIIGMTNAGKSTLINSILNKEISVATYQKQTTRFNIVGIYNDAESQICFIDTPGFFKSEDALTKSIRQSVNSSLIDADAVIYLHSILEKEIPTDIKQVLGSLKCNVILALNKVDKLPKDVTFERIVALKDMFKWAEIVPISALKKINTQLLVKVTKKYLTEGERYFPLDQKSDLDMASVIREKIRKSALLLTSQEIPHSVGIKIIKIEDGKKLTIDAELICERPSQKAILIGKAGEMIKQIKAHSKTDIINYYNKDVILRLEVAVIKDWKRRNDLVELLK